MTDTAKTILYSLDGSVARITLNRPEKRNALNEELLGDLKQALRDTEEDKAVRCVVIAGAGSDFCSGADLSALEKISKSSAGDNMADASSLAELYLLIRHLQVPVVAAVHGRALAGGCGLAMSCDLVLAAANARFGYPEVKIGFVPAMVSAILRRNVSEKLAFELLTCGDEIDAHEAHRIGLINRVFRDDTFLEEVKAYAERFSSRSKSAVSLTKAILYQIDGLAFRDAIDIGADVNVIARQTDDCRQGIAKFLNRRFG